MDFGANKTPVEVIREGTFRDRFRIKLVKMIKMANSKFYDKSLLRIGAMN